MLTSTILTLLVIPTIYEVLDDWRAWALDRWRRIGGLPEALPATREAGPHAP